MSNKGFIVIDRKIMDWKYWHNHTALAIWLYILVEANWKPGFWGSGGEAVDRGELITSQKKIADFFGLDRRTVKRYLELFEQEGQIEIDVNNHRTKIKVVNYAKYQDYSTPDVQQNVQQDVHQNVQQDVHPDVHNRTNITNKQRNNGTKEDIYTSLAAEVLEYLNTRTDSKYRPLKSTLREITARLREGYTVENCKEVIDKKCVEWSNDEHMAKYLRPSTLFQAGKFPEYLNQKGAAVSKPRNRFKEALMEEEAVWSEKN